MKKLIITLLLATPYCYTLPIDKPVHLNDAKKLFTTTGNHEELDRIKKNIINYYHSKDGYEKDVITICHNALDYLTNRTIHKNDAIIFDIDETLLSERNLFFEKNLEWIRGEDTHPFRMQKKCTVIKPMLDLCRALKLLGYKLIAITSRNKDFELATRENLTSEGFPEFDQIVLVPIDLYHKVSAGTWKESERIKLSTTYTIVGSFSDSTVDLDGACCGEYIALLPNYFY